jgi:hypothetical protein
MNDYNEKVFAKYRQKADQMAESLLYRMDKLEYDPGSAAGSFSAANVVVPSASDVSVDSIRKAINEAKELTKGYRPPDVIFMSQEAMETLFARPEVMPFVDAEDSNRINFRMRFEGIPIIRMPRALYLSDCSSPSPSPAKVVWRVGPPAEVVPVWQYLLVVVVLALILVLLGGVV